MRLARARSPADAYFDASPAGMSMVDSELRYLKVNQRLADITRAANGGTPRQNHP